MKVRAGRRPWVDSWRTSIQFRVVIATALLSLVVVIVLAATLLRQVSAGLVSNSVDVAVEATAAGIAQAESSFEVADEIDPGFVGQLLTLVVEDLSTSGASSGHFDVVLLNSTPEATTTSTARATRASGGVQPDSVPAALREQVQNEPSLFWTYGNVQYSDGRSEAAIVAGQQIFVPTTGFYELYYLFPLTDEADTLRLVRQAVFTAGILLVLMLAGVGWLVIRQVVTPVQEAADTAERLSSGDLSQRLAVPGSSSERKDELARLALSFNHMADSIQSQIVQLEALSRMQQRFVSDVSHELRTPLTTVRMAADHLHDQPDELSPSGIRSIELMRDELDRFEALLADLLEISRIDAGAAALELEEVDLRDEVRSVAAALRGLEAKTGSELSVDLPDEAVIATVDPRRVSRVVRNLVANALEHGRGRPVLIRMAADRDTAAVAVRDYGSGLTVEQQSRVFQRFWRADPARTRTAGGTGLGLAIASEDARLHNGWLAVWGSPGQGSQFVLTLPRRPGAAPSTLIPVVPADAVEAIDSGGEEQ